ncbi:hypothetical protein [Spirosoma sp. 48-14]|uniref:hypothetical protein n=1 Tax=Spirosoma sp. 48-14 TaxID=1895854 RepID=UPI000969BA84|nr:hypothetical protein [Spirosoma sp. 48-14]OJW75686.1 MAG: hypothetical protein BGO59_08965 [Spirosoma sp. 48-14]
MSKLKIETTCFQLKHGHLRLDVHGVKQTYLEGVYMHSLGVVHVYCEKAYCRIDTSWGATWYMRERRDQPTPRQISNFCRQLLKDIHS